MDFFGIGPLEVLLILIIALLVFGPHRLPEIGRTLGRVVRAFKKVAMDFSAQIAKEMEEEEKRQDKP